MADKSNIREQFDDLKCCVIIPTYNNAQTLRNVISEVLEYTGNVIVVNDGSTDTTKEIIESFADLKTIHFPENKGKGYALRKAIKFAFEQGYNYGITIDSDGQHLPSDLPLFIEKIKENPEAIIIGSRNMEQEGVPGKSSFGNKFSSFWFYIETGNKLPDTQSGFRSYPLFLLHNRRFYGRKFEFEVEVLVRSSWKRIEIIPLPISVYYAPKTERISHFRPFTDFARISLLNILLVIYAFLIVNPFRFVKALNKKNIKEFFQKEFIQSEDKDSKIIFSVMLGVFIGVAPIWGWQMGMALILAMLFKLNRMITIVACNVSIPPMIPVIIYLSYLFGGIVYHHDAVYMEYSHDITLVKIKLNVIQYLIGSLFFGIILSAIAGLGTLILLKIFRKKRILTEEVKVNTEK